MSSLEALLALKLWHEIDGDCKTIQKQSEYSFSGAYTSLPVLLTKSKLTALYVLSHVRGMENWIMSTNTINQEKM